tara:strand:- start:125 stop:505 length:381 start_codon:yes stop_codon:yes gene_type:complete
MSIYRNITGSDETSLLTGDYDEVYGTVYTNMTLCNSHATDSVTIDLFIRTNDKEYWHLNSDNDNDSSSGDVKYTDYTYYILNNVVIPNGATLKLEPGELVFGEKYNLKIKLSASDSAVDVLIYNTK